MIYSILLWNISADNIKNGYTYCIFIFATVFGFEQPFYTLHFHLGKDSRVKYCLSCARARVCGRALSSALMKHVIKLDNNLSTNSLEEEQNTTSTKC